MFRRETVSKAGTKTCCVRCFRDPKGKYTLTASTDPIHYNKDLYDFQPIPNHGINISDPCEIFQPHPFCKQTHKSNNIKTMKNTLLTFIKDTCEAIACTHQGERELFLARNSTLTASQAENE